MSHYSAMKKEIVRQVTDINQLEIQSLEDPNQKVH